MSKDVKLFAIKVACLVLLLILSLGFIKFLIDPLGLFREDCNVHQIGTDQRHIKMKLLLQHKINKHSFIWGSSRVEAIHTQNNINFKQFYNMTYGSGLPQQHLEDLKVLLDHGIKIEALAIGLDDVSYLLDNHPQYSGYLLSKLRFFSVPYLGVYYSNYLFRPFDIVTYFDSVKVEDYDFYNGGSGCSTSRELWIETHPKEHVMDPVFTHSISHSNYRERIDFTIDVLKQIQSLCAKNHIQFTVFINPMHVTTYKSQNMKDYFRFLKELSLMTDFYDFSGINRITTHNYYYYEICHYRPMVGDMIIKRLLEEKNNNGEFGFYCTSKNIDAHIAQLKSEL